MDTTQIPTPSENNTQCAVENNLAPIKTETVEPVQSSISFEDAINYSIIANNAIVHAIHGKGDLKANTVQAPTSSNSDTWKQNRINKTVRISPDTSICTYQRNITPDPTKEFIPYIPSQKPINFTQKCHTCGRSFPSRKQLYKHFNHDFCRQKQTLRHKCGECKKIHNDLIHQGSHVLSHHKQKSTITIRPPRNFPDHTKTKFCGRCFQYHPNFNQCNQEDLDSQGGETSIQATITSKLHHSHLRPCIKAQNYSDSENEDTFPLEL